MLPNTDTTYLELAARFGLDILALSVFLAVVALKRGTRRDLVTVFACFNVGLFIVLTVISTSKSATAIGFGLFAMLSIIRLRSEPFGNSELGYFFAALVLALVNGVLGGHLLMTVVLDLVVLTVVVLVEHPRLGPPLRSRNITLDTIHTDDAALRADLEHRLGVHVVDFTIHDVDYVRDVTVVSIRYRDRPLRTDAAVLEGVR